MENIFDLLNGWLEVQNMLLNYEMTENNVDGLYEKACSDLDMSIDEGDFIEWLTEVKKIKIVKDTNEEEVEIVKGDSGEEDEEPQEELVDDDLSDSKDEVSYVSAMIQENDGCETCKLYKANVKKGEITIPEVCSHKGNIDENGGYKNLPKHINALKQCGWYDKK